MSLRLVLLWSSYFADLFLRVVRLILFNRLSAFDIYFLIVVPYLLRVLDAFDSNVISVRPDTVLIKGGIMSIHIYTPMRPTSAINLGLYLFVNFKESVFFTYISNMHTFANIFQNFEVGRANKFRDVSAFLRVL